MTQPKLTIAQLYPRQMNLYGDWGNVLTLKKRIEWRGIDVEVIEYHPGDDFSGVAQTADILVGGGGQDSGQTEVYRDLLEIGDEITRLANDGMPMLMICGMYQLFGRSFTTVDGTEMQGIGLLDITTAGGETRMIGNIITHSEQFGDIIGYENHSGQTMLGADMTPFGTVVLGAGNNERDGHEGVLYRNVIGTYLHGSLLPKNPQVADFLIETAWKRRYPKEQLPPFNAPHIDELTKRARTTAAARPR